jgi:hypothetical protein
MRGEQRDPDAAEADHAARFVQCGIGVSWCSAGITFQ